MYGGDFPACSYTVGLTHVIYNPLDPSVLFNDKYNLEIQIDYLLSDIEELLASNIDAAVDTFSTGGLMLHNLYFFLLLIVYSTIFVVQFIDELIGVAIEFVVYLIVQCEQYIQQFSIYTYRELRRIIWQYILLFFEKKSCLYFFLVFVLTNVFSFFLQNYLGQYGIFCFNLASLFIFWLSLVSQWPIFFSTINSEFFINLGQWVAISVNYRVDFLLHIDSLAYSFILLTSTIALYVYAYAFAYFRYEPHVDRLLIFLNLFVISMILLVAAGNLVILFLGWELIGLTSFFLINFWSTKISTLKAAFKAFLFNRFSDVSLFFICIYSFYICHDVTNTVVINTFTSKADMIFSNTNCVEMFAFFIIIPISIKSAQFFWHIWLPDSMEAPVPASALIHSATLVSAGVYLVLRFKSILVLSSYAMWVLPLTGAFTACLGAFSSVYQTDVKKLLAYSTISHCGFLIVSAILCDSEYTILYLYVHGFFKAASFICIGNVIRFNFGGQDMRTMGGYAKYLPFECCALLITLLFLAGAPFTFGFYMKHLLLAALPMYGLYNKIVVVLLSIGACLGIAYCSKLYYGIFFGTKKSNIFVYSAVANYDFYRYDRFGTIFTNATIASILSIFGLILSGCSVCAILLIVMYNRFMNAPDFGFEFFSSALYSLKMYTSKAALFNFSLLNWVMLLLLLFLCVVNFTRIFSAHTTYILVGTSIFLLQVIFIVISLVDVIDQI